MPRPFSQRGRRPKAAIPVRQIRTFYMPGRFSFRQKQNPLFSFSALALECAFGTRLTPSAVGHTFCCRAGMEREEGRRATAIEPFAYCCRNGWKPEQDCDTVAPKYGAGGGPSAPISN